MPAMTLKRVGVKNLFLPVQVRQKSGGRQHTVATFAMSADLPRTGGEDCARTLLAVMERFLDDFSFDAFAGILMEVRQRLEAKTARLEMTFPYFIAKHAPVTGTASLMEYSCRFVGTVNPEKDFSMTVWVPVTTLCPCSKEIADAGAHNQRAEVELSVRFRRFVWLEDLIRLVEASGSSELFALLKRPDEKHVTEEAYNNPMFVEDVVRNVATRAAAHPDISWFSVAVESFESIHKHSAYAQTDSSALT